MEMIGSALATSIMQIPKIRICHKILLLEIPPTPNNVQYSQSVHQFQSYYDIFASSMYNLDDNVEMTS